VGANGFVNSDPAPAAQNTPPMTNNAAETVASAANSASRQDDPSANKRVPKRAYNGRVIMINAYIRSAPSNYAPAIAVAPLDELVKIGRPAGPWYRVMTSGGRTGWMHGNTIEFVR